MNIQKIEFWSNAIYNEILKQCRILGTQWEVHIFAFLFENSSLSPEERHFEVAKIGLAHLSDKIHADIAERIEKYWQPSYSVFEMQYDENMLKNSHKKILPQVFLGKYFDSENNRVIVRGVEYKNSYFFHTDTENPKHAVKNISPDFPDGFVYAVLEPPYGFGDFANIHEKWAYILDSIELLFDDISLCEIFEWSQDCSNFFDAGKEWWGTFFYTVYNPTKNIYFSILASATD